MNCCETVLAKKYFIIYIKSKNMQARTQRKGKSWWHTGTMWSRLPTEELWSWVGKALPRHVSLPVCVFTAYFVTAEWYAISGVSVCDRTTDVKNDSVKKRSTQLPCIVTPERVGYCKCCMHSSPVTPNQRYFTPGRYLERLWSSSANLNMLSGL